MLPKLVDLLSQFENENCRNEQWIWYDVYIQQHPVPFQVKGPQNVKLPRLINTQVLSERAQIIYDGLPPAMFPRYNFMLTQVLLTKYVQENY